MKMGLETSGQELGAFGGDFQLCRAVSKDSPQWLGKVCVRFMDAFSKHGHDPGFESYIAF